MKEILSALQGVGREEACDSMPPREASSSTTHQRCESGAYEIHHQVLDTKDNGVPQSRRRWYCVGIRKDVIPTHSGEDGKSHGHCHIDETGRAFGICGTCGTMDRKSVASDSVDLTQPHFCSSKCRSEASKPLKHSNFTFPEAIPCPSIEAVLDCKPNSPTNDNNYKR